MFSACAKKNLELAPKELAGPFPNVVIHEVNGGNGPCEPSISIDPNNPKKMVAGSILDNVYVSSNGGKTWSNSRLSSSHGVYGDPVIRHGINGQVYYSHLSNPKGKAYSSEEFLDRIVIQKSEDGGKTWTDGSFPPCDHKKDHDKQWLAIHPKKGDIAMAWTEFDKYNSTKPEDKSKILFSLSKDGGNSWSSPAIVSDRMGNCLDDDGTTEGGHAAFDEKGNIYVIWAHEEKIYMDISQDGGKTWGQDRVIATQEGGWAYSIPGLRRCNGFPTIKIDHSQGENHGKIYVQWSQQKPGSEKTSVYVISSDDQGKTWSKPMNIHPQEQGHHFLSWMDIDPSNGFIYLVYYHKSDAGFGPVDVYLSYSMDGGLSFKSVKINEKSFEFSPMIFFGDYNDISVVNGVVRPIWTQLEGTKLSVHTALIHHKS